jgi:glutamyl-Q tRNA(Asp) synthetase
MTPAYLHLPIALDETGKKISKSTSTTAENIDKPGKVLIDALQFLGQNTPKDLEECDVKSILDWATENWDTNLLPRQKEIQNSSSIILN